MAMPPGLDLYPCGGVPRPVLTEAGFEELPSRCPRAQSGNATGLESPWVIDEFDFLACSLLDEHKFLTFTPVSVLGNAQSPARDLLEWAVGHTTCEFSSILKCPKCDADGCVPDGALALERKANLASSRRPSPWSADQAGSCRSDVFLTMQPGSNFELAEMAKTLYEATGKDMDVPADQSGPGLSAVQGHMAFGIILGYRKFAVREFMGDSVKEGKYNIATFDEDFDAAVKWILRHLRSAKGTEFYDAVETWPFTPLDAS